MVAQPAEILAIQQRYGNQATQEILGHATPTDVIQRDVDDTPNLKPSEKESHALLSEHIAKKSAEHKALDENWNINAAGRNQGLAHIIDYGFARPKIGDAKSDPKLPAPAADLTEKETAAYQRFMQGHSATKIQVERFFGKDPSSKAVKALLQELPMPPDKKIVADQQRLKERRAEMTAGFSESSQFAAFARSEAGQALKKEEAALKQRQADATVYTRAQADSKKGRIERIARGTGEDEKAFKGNEILGVTAAVQKLRTGQADKFKYSGADASKPYREKGWIPGNAAGATFQDSGKIRRYDKSGAQSEVEASWRTGERDVVSTHEFGEGDLKFDEEDEGDLHVSKFGPRGKAKLSSAY